MNNALVGYSGFVGSTLRRQTHFDGLYRSTNIHEIEGKSFDHLVCAGAPAQKWIANRDPEIDRENITRLIDHLKGASCNTFVLISTVDVFKNPLGVDETTSIDASDLHAYGLHRWMLENFVREHFQNHLIVRLPGLVGPGLRKNVVFDLLNNNNLDIIDSRSVFQFYPIVNLWWDIQIALSSKLKLVHLTAAPISVSELSLQGFGHPFIQVQEGVAAAYDFQSCHTAVFGIEGWYQYSARESIQAIRAYAQSEPMTLNRI